MRTPSLVRRMDAWLGGFLRTVCTFGLASLLVILAVNVMARVTSAFSMSWFDEIIELLFAWTVFLAAAELWRTRTHFAIDLLSAALKDRMAGRALNVFVSCAGLVFAAALFYYSYLFVLRTTQLTAILEIPRRFTYACMPVAGFIMCIYALRDFILAIRGLAPAARAADAGRLASQADANGQS